VRRGRADPDAARARPGRRAAPLGLPVHVRDGAARVREHGHSAPDPERHSGVQLWRRRSPLYAGRALSRALPSSTARTLASTVLGTSGFWTKSYSDPSTPRRTIASAV